MGCHEGRCRWARYKPREHNRTPPLLPRADQSGCHCLAGHAPQEEVGLFQAVWVRGRIGGGVTYVRCSERRLALLTVQIWKHWQRRDASKGVRLRPPSPGSAFPRRTLSGIALLGAEGLGATAACGGGGQEAAQTKLCYLATELLGLVAGLLRLTLGSAVLKQRGCAGSQGRRHGEGWVGGGSGGCERLGAVCSASL